MRVVDIPGRPRLIIERLVLDMNGTLSDRGDLVPGVLERIRALDGDVEIHILTADTFGRAAGIGEELGLPVTIAPDAASKVAFVRRVGAARTAAIGNGRNDVAMLREAGVGIAILGPEGAATAAILAADVVSRSITDALELLLDERLLIATLRE